MSWLYEKQTYDSEKNGAIVRRRIFGIWKILVDGCDQTSAYTNLLWRLALRRVPKNEKIKHVLLLGLGAGGAVRSLRRRFPDCVITIVEWDPVMVDIAKTLPFLHTDKVTIIVDDASARVGQFTQPFDLIIIDLFRGSHIPSFLSDDAFLKTLYAIVSPCGYVLFNAFWQVDLIETVRRHFSFFGSWQFLFNRVALFRPRGNGCLGDPLLPGYVHRQQSRINLEGTRAGRSTFQIMEQNGYLGLRWKVGPLRFESYTGDIEPTIEHDEHTRLVLWDPITRADQPKGWWRPWMHTGIRQSGTHEITDTQTYWKDWTSHAQRHRKKWLREQSYRIEEAPLEEFIAGYRSTGKLITIRNAYFAILRRKAKTLPHLLHLYAARDPKNNEIVAGLATFDLPDIRSSEHVIAFYHPNVARTSVNYGLIDRWFQDAIAHNIRFLDFGVFWAPGDPRAFKGFSKFKKQFGVYLTRYPHPLMRLVRKQKK